ncbi:odorant receptor 131-2-like [Cololabis saira]|uniref:odorant receptor 131-2-like n=1 Tax=Cololabis saira TaxID=129043 RepID=UPI002AD243C5|nr:odorant receptor 131-2-like [Cololabis saira]
MNSSSYNFNVSSSLSIRDSPSTAVAKNVIVLALGLVINYINGTLVHTFRKHQIFYVNPRYILYIHLVLNMIQLNIAISLFVFSYVFYKINASLCCLMVTFATVTTINTPLNLAVMAVECYIAICFPLRHSKLCTIKRTYVLIGCIWTLSLGTIVPDIFITLATEPVGLFSSTIFCDIDKLFRHPVISEKRDVSYLIYLTSVWLTLLYTYFKIFFAAKAANSVDGNFKKARNTILLHGFQLLLSMVIYVFHILQTALIQWFPEHFLQIFFVCYVIIQILPRFISPIVYGLRDSTFKRYLRKYLLCTMRALFFSYFSSQLIPSLLFQVCFQTIRVLVLFTGTVFDVKGVGGQYPDFKSITENHCDPLSAENDSSSIQKSLKVTSYCIVVLRVYRTWSLFERCLIFELDSVFDFCCMTEVKIMMGKYIGEQERDRAAARYRRIPTRSGQLRDHRMVEPNRAEGSPNTWNRLQTRNQRDA